MTDLTVTGEVLGCIVALSAIITGCYKWVRAMLHLVEGIQGAMEGVRDITATFTRYVGVNERRLNVIERRLNIHEGERAS